MVVVTVITLKFIAYRAAGRKQLGLVQRLRKATIRPLDGCTHQVPYTVALHTLVGTGVTATTLRPRPTAAQSATDPHRPIARSSTDNCQETITHESIPHPLYSGEGGGFTLV